MKLYQRFILSCESRTTDREPVDTAHEFLLDIGNASNISASLYLIALHQKTQRSNPVYPANNLSNNRFNKSFSTMLL